MFTVSGSEIRSIWTAPRPEHEERRRRNRTVERRRAVVRAERAHRDEPVARLRCRLCSRGLPDRRAHGGASARQAPGQSLAGPVISSAPSNDALFLSVLEARVSGSASAARVPSVRWSFRSPPRCPTRSRPSARPSSESPTEVACRGASNGRGWWRPAPRRRALVDRAESPDRAAGGAANRCSADGFRSPSRPPCALLSLGAIARRASALPPESSSASSTPKPVTRVARPANWSSASAPSI